VTVSRLQVLQPSSKPSDNGAPQESDGTGSTTFPQNESISLSDFCPECIWNNGITCQARAEYIARKYKNGDQTAAIETILSDPSNLCRRRHRPCIVAPYPTGWGNAVFLVLYSLLIHHQTSIGGSSLPCVRGYGEVFGQLFANIEPCPAEYDVGDVNCTHLGAHPPWREIIDRVQRDISDVTPSLMLLNGTFVRELLALTSLTAEELQSSCAVHVRFGDAYIRNGTNAYDRRLCRRLAGSESKCFKQVARQVQQKCPNQATPLYIASDNLGFVHYFSTVEPNRTLFSGKVDGTNSSIVHINDLSSVNLTSRSVQMILRDWFALVLSDTSSAISRSSFSQSASLGFSLSEDDAQQSPLMSITGDVCKSNPYVGSLDTTLEDMSLQATRWLGNVDQELAKANQPRMRSFSHKRYYPFQEMASCNQACIGGECGDDDSKIVCGVEKLQEGCVVYAIGGDNEWSFELDVLKRTPCEVHTFDCTGQESRFQPPHDPRLHFHHICLGRTPIAAPEDCEDKGVCGAVMTLEQIQTMLEHDRIDLLKMDIEGFEWPVLDSWRITASQMKPMVNTTVRVPVLPMQVLVEVSVYFPTGCLRFHLSNATYACSHANHASTNIHLPSHSQPCALVDWH